MRNSITSVLLITILGLASCGAAEYESYSEEYEEPSAAQAYEENADYAEKAETEMYTEQTEEYSKQEEWRAEDHQQAIYTLAACAFNDSSLRFIRTAQIDFKTANVRNTTYYLENAVVNLGGIVTYTNLYSDIENVKKVAVSNDSSLKVTTYQVKNNMTIRIPSHQLDSLLKVVSKSVTFLDRRVVNAEEISLKELANQLEQKRLADYQVQLKDAIEDKDGKIHNVVDAYENMLYKQQQEDEALIRNLEIDYDVDYSVVQLYFYQDSAMDKELVENELNVEEFEPDFSTKFGESLKNGWNAILDFIVVIANIWFLIIPGVIVGFIFLRRRKRSKSE
jgi:hypothetical protein